MVSLQRQHFNVRRYGERSARNQPIPRLRIAVPDTAVGVVLLELTGRITTGRPATPCGATQGGGSLERAYCRTKTAGPLGVV
jgi:hypothetical protein